MTAKAALQLLGVLANRTVRLPARAAADEASWRSCAACWPRRPPRRRHLHEPPAPRAVRRPARSPRSGLRVIPLGGLGEVGRNMTVFEYDGRLLIVDCGVLFPEDHQPGVDLILPDFDPIRDRLDEVEALVLTHGHEDHIGATPYLLRERGDIPLVGSQADAGAARAPSCGSTGSRRPCSTSSRRATGSTFGPFDLEFVAVNHSIPDALAVAIRTGAGIVLHTGDFKMDQLPLDGRITDLRAFARLGEEGVDLFMVDSTNAEVPGLHHLRGARSGRCSTGSSTAAGTSGSSSPASPRTCTACSR